jgi:non-structural maintenance of chromosomes element 1
MAYRFILHM